MYVLLQDLTWVEAEKALKRAKVTIIPVGSLEQHGPHLTLDTDTVRAFEIARRAAERARTDVVILPPVPYGVSPHHMSFPGTITLSPQTLISLIVDICRSLKVHGVERVVIVNGHGGNSAVLQVAARIVKDELGMKVALINCAEIVRDVIEETVESDIWGHACEYETSQVMAINPGKVRFEALRKAEMREVKLPYVGPGRRGANVPLDWSELTMTGSIGDPTLATKEKGEKLVNAAAERIAEFLERFAEY